MTRAMKTETSRPVDAFRAQKTKNRARSRKLLEAALAYAEDGRAVVPLHEPRANGKRCTCSRGPECGSPGKHPRVARGHRAATTDPKKIRAWWAKWPTAGIGGVIRPGELVVDIDPRNGGEESFRELEEEHGPFPATRTCETGGGGAHLYYLVEPGVKLRNGELAPGVEVKASGSLVLPPSAHSSGRRYKWEDAEAAIEPAPEWLLALLDKGRQGATPNGEPVHLERVLAVLKAQAAGQPRQWTAICPAHDDTNPSLSVSMAPDGQVLLYCFAGCAQEAVLAAAGLTWADLAPGRGGAVRTSGWKLVDLADVPTLDVPEPEWFVEGLIPRGGLGWVFGPPKARKSLLLLDLVLHIAHGVPWLDRFATRPARTLYIAREDGLARIKSRVAELNAVYGFDAAPQGSVFFLARERFRVTDRAHCQWLDEAVQAHGVEFLILDVLNRMIPGLDENSAKDMGAVIDVLEWMTRDLGLTVACVDHARKPANAPRKKSAPAASAFDLKGSVAKYGAADWLMHVVGGKGGRLHLEAENKDTDDPPNLLLQVAAAGSGAPKFSIAGDPDALGERQRQKGSATRTKILLALGAEGKSLADLKAAVKMADSTVRDHLNRLVDEGLAEVTGKTSSRKWRRKS